jgi:hypothetical protein
VERRRLLPQSGDEQREHDQKRLLQLSGQPTELAIEAHMEGRLSRGSIDRPVGVGAEY